VLCAAAFCENLLEQAGPRFAGPIAILRNWTYCLFYVMAELWGSVVVSVLFWGFANQVRCCCWELCCPAVLVQADT
jgi:AAA family ATP:ADP antiporter